MKRRKKLADHLTPDDRREAEAVADALDGLLVRYRQAGSVPLDALRFVRFRLWRLARVEPPGLPPGWEGIQPVTGDEAELVGAGADER